MDTSKHTLATLFAQLGLANSPEDINQFIATHQISAGTPLAQASFWTPAQANLIRKALADDADWSEVVDSLAVRLSAS
ncbi:MAG TPA: DUF2789 domain-containing protein [Agitococcus sp.]|nr:DUF2789 domain-containing protein [Agitococcus sp.]HMX99398.1 DUF2789 domain-containing protein [Agitococcus sp.]HMY28911.1 DUF2789 domain-containing protein [Agitococcus sp.]HMY82576.1 DUF2789 domain-containing protein [Agitococcus sp.]HNA20845.1 DUF2789 domain-containing protein [Agitococcus sp.]